MRRMDLDEAAAILRRLLAALAKAVQNPHSDAAADMRQSIGALSSGAESAIAGFRVGVALVSCFRDAYTAGASFNAIDATRRGAIDEEPVGTPATIVVAAYVQQALVTMSRIVADMEFTSRDQVEDYRSRLSAAFDTAEEDAANEEDATSYQALVRLHAAAVRDLTARARPLPLMVPYAWDSRYPAPWISNRLYGTGGRYGEVIAENKVVHPLFMPEAGRALSR